MDQSDIIMMSDKKYAGEDAVVCPNEGVEVKSGSGQTFSSHGKLTVHGTGSYLVCGRCGYNTPIGRIN